ncbi:MAG: efflux RND transporter periplasmic adaptor subunit [Desulfuromonadales bacterium]|uniref:efflux RND transporter periplasmic adaptor subunit n=1 Tax=Desulfuromonas sp. KJ2020 TaxID=2919173 RepID=UPI0003212985|nr:efflux RND transporter periplasmic adaptor subunit [Desulfuromonas sp. KJ2020]MCP3176137.1 efflux RND transporter periplasmic adaptor subunit [Desulfuromonas sp. KJ2020]
MMKKRLLGMLILLVVLAAALLLVARKKMELAEAPRPTLQPTVIRTAVSERGDLTRTRTYLGRVEAWQSADISSRLTSVVAEVKVREGERVRQGEVLLRLDDTELRRALQGAAARVANAREQAEAVAAKISSLRQSLAFWKKEEERDRTLASAGAIAPAQAEATADRLNQVRGELEATLQSLQAARSLVESQRQQQQEAAARLAYAEIRSPFDGLVARRLVDPGDLAAPGQRLLEIEDHSRLQIRFDIPQKDVHLVEKERQVIVEEDGQSHALAISRLYPTVNPDQTLTMEAELPAVTSWRPGAYVPVSTVVERAADVILVPEDSLIPSPEGGLAVFVVEEGVTRPLPVQLLLSEAGLAAVSGLDEGVTVVLSTYLGWNRLAGGEAVEVRP